jgi:hypothetical protein
MFEQDILTMQQMYEPVSSLMKSIPDPKDVSIQNEVEIERPLAMRAPKEGEKAEDTGVANTLLGFKYPPKPPDWDRASPIEKFNFITLPISDIMGRVGGKIASDWRMMKKEDVQKLLVSELDEDLKWYQKSPEAVGWTAEKVAEYMVLKGVFKASGLHKALTAAGQKAAAPFIAKEITARGGLKAISTWSSAGIKGLIRKGMTSFLTAAPENTAFISSWSALDAVLSYPALEAARKQSQEILNEYKEEATRWSVEIAKDPKIAESTKYKSFIEEYNEAIKQHAEIPKDLPSSIKKAAVSGAGWGLALTAGFAVIGTAAQAPEMRMAFAKAIQNVGKRFPSMLDKLGKPVTEEVEKEWLKALSKSQGKDLRIIDLAKRERQMFRNAIRAAEKEILKAADREAAIQAYWTTKAAKAATKPVTKAVKVEKPPTEAVTAPSKPVSGQTVPGGQITPPEAAGGKGKQPWEMTKEEFAINPQSKFSKIVKQPKRGIGTYKAGVVKDVIKDEALLKNLSDEVKDIEIILVNFPDADFAYKGRYIPATNQSYFLLLIKLQELSQLPTKQSLLLLLIWQILQKGLIVDIKH